MAEAGHEVVGIDNLNLYYDVSLKMGRLAAQGFTPSFDERRSEISADSRLRFRKLDICDKVALLELFKQEKFDYVIHLAA